MLTFTDLGWFYNHLHVSKVIVKPTQIGETKINIYFRTITECALDACVSEALPPPSLASGAWSREKTAKGKSFI